MFFPFKQRVVVKKTEMHDKHNYADSKTNIGDIKSRKKIPAKLKTQKIDHFTVRKSVDIISDRASNYKIDRIRKPFVFSFYGEHEKHHKRNECNRSNYLKKSLPPFFIGKKTESRACIDRIR